MIILVDGPDGTGKTGYSRFLADEYGFVRLEMGPVDDLEAIEQKSAVFNDTIVQLYRQGIDVVVDRGPVSSLVYSRVRDRQPEAISNARKTIGEIDPVIVWLDCDSDELNVRYSDEFFDQKDMTEIVETYHDVMTGLRDDGITVKRIDTSTGALDKIRELADSEVIEGRLES